MKKLFIIASFIFLSSSFAFSEDWKIKNKWKVSCGIADKESLVVNGKPKNIGHTIFETDIFIEGAPQHRSTVFQIHDGRNKGAPPSWIGVGMDWKIKYKFPKGECSPENCKEFKNSFLKPGKKYRFKADIDYQRKAKNLSIKYYLDNELIAQHLNVPLSKKKTDGPYGPSKPYIKIGIYRIGETGTTSFAYNNLIIKNKKK